MTPFMTSEASQFEVKCYLTDLVMCVNVVLEIWDGPKKVCAHRCLDNSDAKCKHTLERCECRILSFASTCVCAFKYYWYEHEREYGAPNRPSEVKSLILGGMSDCLARFWLWIVGHVEDVVRAA